MGYVNILLGRDKRRSGELHAGPDEGTRRHRPRIGAS